MTDDDDHDHDHDPPDRCPACGGDVSETALGLICDDCQHVVATLDSRGDADA